MLNLFFLVDRKEDRHGGHKARSGLDAQARGIPTKNSYEFDSPFCTAIEDSDGLAKERQSEANKHVNG